VAQLGALSDAFTVVAWDAPGFGGSDDPPDGFTLADYADCLAGFIRALGFSRAHVIGMSFGGGLAIELYGRAPDVVASLTLASAYAGWAASLPRDEVAHRLQQALRLADLSGDELASTLMPTMFSDQAPPELSSEFEAAVRDFHPSGLRATARAFAAADLRNILSTIAVPTLLLYGDRDVRAPIVVGQAIHDAIRGSKFVVIPGCGHILNIEAATHFNAEVRAFLTSVGEPSRRAS